MASSIVIDNGAGELKFGHAGATVPRGRIPNCIAKVDKENQILVADEVDTVYNGATLRYQRPFDRGFLLNWQHEIEIWQRVFGPTHLNINPTNHSLVLTEAPCTPESLQNDMNEVVFEDFGFNSYIRRPAAWYSSYEFSCSPPPGTQCAVGCLVVDSGFSFSHAVPFIANKCIKHACKRVNVGGKLLTNYLKEVVSYRQWNMMDEFRLMDQVKQGLCFVSQDLPSHLSRIAREGRSRADVGVFVLPDYHHLLTGYVLDERDGETMMEISPSGDGDEGLQRLALDVERPAVPEILFRPGDSNVGLGQCGVAEAAWQAVKALPLAEMALVASNIVLTGGSVKFPGFRERFIQEFRPNVPDVIDVQVYLPDMPDLYAWRGASNFATSDLCARSLVTRKEYLEHGHHYCNRKMDACW